MVVLVLLIKIPIRVSNFALPGVGDSHRHTLFLYPDYGGYSSYI